MSESADDRDTLPQPDWHQEWTDLTPDAAIEPSEGLPTPAADLPTSRKVKEDPGDESQTESRAQIRRQEGGENRQEGQQEGQQGGK